jgi:hypothetical protein
LILETIIDIAYNRNRSSSVFKSSINNLQWPGKPFYGLFLNLEEVLAVLPDYREEAKSIKEIALAIGLEVSS